jgi:hypothetical protein
VEQEHKIVGYEEVTVPAGTFKTYRIDAILRTQSGLYGEVSYWVNSDGYFVKQVRRAQSRGRDGRTLDSSWIKEAARIHRPR